MFEVDLVEAHGRRLRVDVRVGLHRQLGGEHGFIGGERGEGVVARIDGRPYREMADCMYRYRP